MVDAATNTVVAATLTTSNEGDASQVGPLLDQGPLDTVMADSAYDGNPTYRTVAGPDWMESIKICGVTWPAPRKAGRLELVSH